MADSAADIGYQSRFKIGNGASPQVYTAIAEVVSFTPPGATFGEVQTTHLGTPGAMHTYRPTLADPGEVPCTVNYIPGGTEEAAMLALFDRSTRSFEIEYPNGARVQFQGFARNFEPGEVALEELLQASFTIRVSGTLGGMVTLGLALWKLDDVMRENDPPPWSVQIMRLAAATGWTWLIARTAMVTPAATVGDEAPSDSREPAQTRRLMVMIAAGTAIAAVVAFIILNSPAAAAI